LRILVWFRRKKTGILIAAGSLDLKRPTSRRRILVVGVV